MKKDEKYLLLLPRRRKGVRVRQRSRRVGAGWRVGGAFVDSSTTNINNER